MIPVYKDFWFKIIGSLVASQLIDSIDRSESYFQRFTTGYFYTDLLGGFLIALLLWEVTRPAIKYLDRRYDWMERPLRRLGAQLVLAVAVPALLSFFLTFGFMRFAYGQDIFQTRWLYNEFYTVVLIILFINLAYFAWWLYLKWKMQSKAVTIAGDAPKNPNSSIEVTKGAKTILLPYHDITYAYLNDRFCYIKTFIGEGYVTTYTLDEVNRLVGDEGFFRVNRQFLINRKSCKAYKSIENGKIEIDLNPPFKEPVIVSQKRAKDFRKWIVG